MSSSPRAPKKTAYHHRDLRRALVTTVLAALERGEDPTVRELARRTGVSHTAAYAHFPDKGTLYAAVAATAFDGLHAALEGAVRGERDPALRLRAAGAAYVAYARSSPARFRLMFGPQTVRAEREFAELHASAEAAFGVLRAAMTEAIRAGGGSASAVEPAVRRAWSLAHGIAMLAVDGWLEPSRDEVLALLTNPMPVTAPRAKAARAR